MDEREPTTEELGQDPEPAPDGSVDEDRLQALNELYGELEAELERDVDETGPAGR